MKYIVLSKQGKPHHYVIVYPRLAANFKAAADEVVIAEKSGMLDALVYVNTPERPNVFIEIRK